MISGPDGGSRTPWLAPLAGCVACLLGAAATVRWAVRAIAGRTNPGWPFVLTFLLAVFAFAAFITFLKRLRADPPEFTVMPDSVRPGEEIRAVYRQRFRRPATITRAAIELVFIEQATKGSGQNLRTFTERSVVATTAVTDRTFGADDELLLALTAPVPADAMHSFKAPQHELLWRVEASVSLKGWPDESDSGIVTVRAERPA